MIAVIGVLGVVTAGVGGCGSSDDSSDSSTAEPLTRSAFIKEANATCKDARAKYFAKAVGDLEAELKAHPGESRELLELRVIKRHFVPAYRAEVDEVRALGIPAGDEQQVEAVLSEVESVLDEAEADPKAFHHAQLEETTPWAKSFAMAKRYGIDFCGQP